MKRRVCFVKLIYNGLKDKRAICHKIDFGDFHFFLCRRQYHVMISVIADIIHADFIVVQELDSTAPECNPVIRPQINSFDIFPIHITFVYALSIHINNRVISA